MTDRALAEPELRPLEASSTAPLPSRTPHPRRRGPRRGWLSWLVVLAVAVGLAWFGYQETRHRLDARTRIELGGISLTAEPVVIESIEGGTVLDIEVTTQQRVAAGDLLAVLDPPPGSLAGPEPLEIRAPSDGTVLSVVPVGSTMSGGDAIAVLYQPDELYFQAPVDFATLTELTIGMTAFVDIPSVGRIETTLERIDTTLPTATSRTAEGVVLILTPADAAALRTIVPGLVLRGWVDTDSGPASGVPAISSFGSG
jgi:multidrug resistance efflux pump